MAKKYKFYVVWKGRVPGIYDNWDDCKAQVDGFDGARYKSFPNRQDAERAFGENPWKHIGRPSTAHAKGATQRPRVPKLIRDSIAVDAACSGNPGEMEYRGVYLGDNGEIFRIGPYDDGTNNIGEFLAIVHALALLKQKNSHIPIYSDSMTAIKWVDKKKCNTKLQRTGRNDEIFDLIERAELWLNTNSWLNPILKWETQHWGENPADFGRK